MATWAIDLAWAAGLFEGEGSIHVQRPRNRRAAQVILQLVSTDEDVIDRLVGVLSGRKYGPYRHKNPAHKPYWRWAIHAQSAAAGALMTLFPFLGQRRKTAARHALLTWRNQAPRWS